MLVLISDNWVYQLDDPRILDPSFQPDIVAVWYHYRDYGGEDYTDTYEFDLETGIITFFSDLHPEGRTIEDQVEIKRIRSIIARHL